MCPSLKLTYLQHNDHSPEYIESSQGRRRLSIDLEDGFFKAVHPEAVAWTQTKSLLAIPHCSYRQHTMCTITKFQKNTVTSQSCCQVRALIQQCQYRPIAAVRHIMKSRTTHQRMSVFRCFSSLLRLYLGPLLFIMALVSWPESIKREEHSHLWRLYLLKLHKQDGNSTLYSYMSQHVLQPLNLLTQLPQSVWSNSAK